MINKNKIQFLVDKIEAELIQIRRKLHMNPELSFNEKETSLFIQKTLDSWNINYTTGWAGYGIVGVIKSNLISDKVVCLRADMDALPIHEDNDLEFASSNKGIMHACGHDIHMTCMLGALYILNELKGEWSGQLKFIFQPGEEKLPGGASIMIQEKVLENPTPDVIIGQHVQANMEVGTVGICPLKAMASCDEIYLSIKGTGGHAALPGLTNNPILIATAIIQELNQLLPQKNVNQVSSVLSIGKFNTEGGATNIIPERVFIEGTFRCMDESYRMYIHEEIRKICAQIKDKYHAEYDLNIAVGYPCLINHPEFTDKFISLSSEYLSPQNIEKLPPRMTSEDFAYYSQQIPAIFYRLGTGPSSSVHTPQFIVNEQSIPIGAGLMAFVASRFLSDT